VSQTYFNPTTNYDLKHLKCNGQLDETYPDLGGIDHSHDDHTVTCYFCGHEYIWAYEIWPCPQCKRRQPSIF
jgi:hypothetical protein